MTKQNLLDHYAKKLIEVNKEIDDYTGKYSDTATDYLLTRLFKKSYYMGAIASLEALEE